jgi:SAM-dependent methyltransferase
MLFEAEWFSGLKLYGDAFTDEEIADWFADEQRGYFAITNGAAQRRPEYDALYGLTLFRHVRGQQFDNCLAIGSAGGNDVRPLAPQVNQFIVIEPTQECWVKQIGGKPASYRAPTLRGKIDMPSQSMDIATTISCLHHIANVSDILREVHRVLRPGAPLLLNEPISFMGDWRKPRVGVTKNERGIPAQWLFNKLAEIGFTIERATPCYFSPMVRAYHLVGVKPFQHPPLVWIDLALCSLTNWNAKYERVRFFRKFAPGQISIVARKSRS